MIMNMEKLKCYFPPPVVYVSTKPDFFFVNRNSYKKLFSGLWGFIQDFSPLCLQPYGS